MIDDLHDPHDPRAFEEGAPRRPRPGFTARSRPTVDRRSAEERELEALFAQLSELPTLDVSQSVLSRLGYRRESRRRARLAGLRRCATRVLSVSITLGVLAGGLFGIEQSRRAAAPGVALDESFRSAVRERSAWIGEVAQGLRPVSALPLELVLPVETEEAAPTRQGPAVRPIDLRPRVPQWPADALRFPSEGAPTMATAVAPLKKT